MINRTLPARDDFDRVRANTSQEVNRELEARAEQRVFAAAAGSRELSSEVGALDREWDFERVMELEAAVTGLTGLLLGVAVDRRFLIVSGVVAVMGLLHSTQGWYPMLPLFRRLGVRTQDEIDRERYAMKALRGDFRNVRMEGEAAERAAAAWRAVCA